MALQNLADKVLLWIHGRRLGIVGDGQTGANSALVLDGVPVATTRAPIVFCQVGAAAAGSLALAGAAIGDNVVSVTNLSTPGDASADFESTITVDGHIQQSSGTDLSAAKLLFVVQPQS